MPDLGKYAEVVLGSYAISLGLLAGIVALSLWRGARVKAALRAIEARRAAGTAPPEGEGAPAPQAGEG